MHKCEELMTPSPKHLFILLQLYVSMSICLPNLSDLIAMRYNCPHGLGIKHQLTYLLSVLSPNTWPSSFSTLAHKPYCTYSDLFKVSWHPCNSNCPDISALVDLV